MGKSFTGYLGSSNQANVFGITGTRPNATFTYAPPFPLTTNNVGYQQPLTSPQEMNSQLAKVRYKFSEATSLAFEFFGLQATLDPEGAEFAQFVGLGNIPQCVTGGKAASNRARRAISVLTRSMPSR